MSQKRTSNNHFTLPMAKTVSKMAWFMPGIGHCFQPDEIHRTGNSQCLMDKAGRLNSYQPEFGSQPRDTNIST